MIRRLAVLLAAVVLFGLLATPVATLLGRAIASGALRLVADSAVVREALRLSLLTTTISLGITVTLGTPLAYLLARRPTRLAWLVEIFVDLPLVLPPSVAGLGLLLVFGRRGLIGDTFDTLGLAIPFTTIAVVLAQVFVASPFYVRAARAAIASVSRDLEDAARVDGASELRVFTAVTLALARPGIGAGLVMSWARSLGEFGATILFAGSVVGRTQTLPLVVYAEFGAGDLDAAIAAAAVLVLAALTVLIAVRLARGSRAVEAAA
ncbi:MAG: molybdate ABC transporter permease subunit [Chloroflexi bacterium]|nr:molybdate ABC transporter permease subunit [Chloroflexota bacterium]